MSQEDADALKNASAIIERFGGIRPMAAKVGAPVTTVQGWKKRDVIPGSRRDDVLRAANQNNIDLTDVLKGDAAPLGAPSVTAVQKSVSADESAFIDAPSHTGTGPTSRNDDIRISVEPMFPQQPKAVPPSLAPRIDTTHDELMAAIRKSQEKAVRVSVWTAAAFVLVLGGAGLYTFMPNAKKVESHDRKIATLEGKVGAIDQDVQEMNETAGALQDLIPSQMQEKMAQLKQEADTIRRDVQIVATQAQDIAKTMTSADAGSLSDRLSVIEAKLANMEGGQALADLASRIRNLEITIAGQDQLQASVAELTTIVDSLDGQVNTLDDKLAQVQSNPGSPLGQTLEGVSDNDLKAAALLIAFSQLRDSLNRNAPFEEDVVLLQKLVGNEDPELQAALTKLAPQAEKGGILTSDGLSEEFKGLAGDIVFSSLKGEDVSVTDQAKARITQALNVKKNGELVGGTPTQKLVAKAQDQLDKGDVQGAIATLNGLDPDAKAKAAPFIQQAEATVLADQIQNMLRQMIVANVGMNLNTAAGVGAGAGTGAVDAVKDVADQVKSVLPGQTVVKDEESGFAILPAPKGFKGFSSGTPE